MSAPEEADGRGPKVADGRGPVFRTPERFGSNTLLYADPALTEGLDWAVRHRSAAGDPTATAVLAPHGGALEVGTSELCLAVAGYRPEDARPAGAGPRHGYWMFEALRRNDGLHVTSAHCDDPVALALCASSRRAVSLHGCGGTGLLIVVGGRDERLARELRAAFAEAFARAEPAVAVETAADCEEHRRLNGGSPANIVNRTGTGRGAQLELSAGLRRAVFGDPDSAEGRRRTYGRRADGGADPVAGYLWHGFVGAVRTAIVRAAVVRADAAERVPAEVVERPS
ncbi:poly-gamma-glutamate hydrolase family protein [Kitasatospora camelliae]|uniref:Poly-gamma-glutamate hydrolase family protein n=1 Tax=Kitasatospora camelliae TaxID=3156397 RepID=A0AAU8JSY0_9ACTN